MIDVIERLQKAETRPLDADGKTQLWETLQDARAEIARLRLTDAEREAAEVARLRDVIKRAASYWIHLDPGVAWEGDIADAMAAAVAEIARLRLTDAEREAVNDAIYLCEAEAGLFGERAAATKWATCAATLRGVSERMGGER